MSSYNGLEKIKLDFSRFFSLLLTSLFAASIPSAGVIEIILFTIPFMLMTNLLVLVAIAKDNVWLLLPWMVLHCVVIAFLALGNGETARGKKAINVCVKSGYF